MLESLAARTQQLYSNQSSGQHATAHQCTSEFDRHLLSFAKKYPCALRRGTFYLFLVYTLVPVALSKKLFFRMTAAQTMATFLGISLLISHSIRGPRGTQKERHWCQFQCVLRDAFKGAASADSARLNPALLKRFTSSGTLIEVSTKQLCATLVH